MPAEPTHAPSVPIVAPAVYAPGMRRRTPTPGDTLSRPELTLIDGGLTAEEVERRATRRRHPAGTGLDPDGPEAV